MLCCYVKIDANLDLFSDSPFTEYRFYTDLSLKELKPTGRPSNCTMSIIGGGSNSNMSTWLVIVMLECSSAGTTLID